MTLGKIVRRSGHPNAEESGKKKRGALREQLAAELGPQRQMMKGNRDQE